MTATYLPPIHSSPARPGDSLLMEALTEGPALARTARSTRWHAIRSAVDVLRPWRDEIDRIYTFWCGPFASRDVITADEPAPGEPTCGTCYGRREGARPDRTDLLFSPRVQPPKTCPGSRTMMCADSTQPRRVTCLVCGLDVKTSAGGGAYNPTYGMQAHAPGPGLVDPCEFHGWKQLTTALGVADRTVVACRCKTVEATR